MREYGPPPLSPLQPVLRIIPTELLPWIAEKHVQYLDDRIHKIDRLTEYLAECIDVTTERNEFISFVENWTRMEDPNLSLYLKEYSARFHKVRERVEQLCDRVLHDSSLWSDDKGLQAFWRDFAYINEVDSLHGMFLTSGRWYVNVMLPAVKELVYCSLPDTVSEGRKNDEAYSIARRVITPRFADQAYGHDVVLERRFVRMFVPILQHYDRKLLFLFQALAEVPVENGETLGTFVQKVSDQPALFSGLLEMGVYPPFAWHELLSSRRARRPALSYDDAVTPLLTAVPQVQRARAQAALDALAIFKDYELNYNNYNYKGRFGLVSKFQYWKTSRLLQSAADKEVFLDAILGDRFYEALRVIQQRRVE